MHARTAALALAAAVALPARAGVLMESTDGGRASTVHIEGNRMRVDAQEGVMIFDGESRTLYQIDPARKNYREMTQADMKAMRAELDRALEQMPPEMRAQVQAQVGGPKSTATRPKAQWEKTGRSDKGLGRTCEIYREIVAGKPTNEVCVVPFEALGVQRADFQVFDAMSEFMQSFAGSGSRPGDWVDWRDVPGMPVVTWDLEDGGGRTEDFRATKIQRASVPADRFKPPAGFEKIPTR